MYKYLFSPITINNLNIKNRIAYPSLGLLFSYDGKLNDKYYNFYKTRAQGGAGIVTIGPVGVDYLGSGILTLDLSVDDAIPDMKKLTDLIKKEGARAWVQLFHAGAYSHPILINGKTPIAPSAIYSNYSKTTPKEMTIDDIKNVQQSFIQAGKRAKEAGFDGVEIIASAGYLITQFLSPKTNQRKDEYGGCFENRIRFPKELIELMRKELGDDYPITIRMAGNDFVTGSITDNETPEIAKVYEKAGVDAINVTGGWHESKVPQLPMDLPRAAYAYLALNIKKAVNVPVMASNRIADPDTAEKMLKDGYADMVNLGRPLIADPFWPKKAFEGRKDEIRPCVACSQGCTDQIFTGKPVFCVGNPLAGFEKEREIIKTDNPKNVMVVGAGPAGLEAAITAHQKGHMVEIYEKDNDLGGQLWIAGAPPHKAEILEYIRYYKAIINKYQIPIHFNTKVDNNLIKDKNPDHLIISSGAEPVYPPIKGLDDKAVLSSWEVLKDNPMLGKNIAIIGGGSVGLETAMFVATKGVISPEVLYFLFAYEAESIEQLKKLMFNGTKKVTVFEMLPKVGKDVGKSTKWILLSNLKKYGVDIITEAKVTEIKDSSITYLKKDETNNQQFDNIIIASGSKSVKTLSVDIKELNIAHSIIGDCVNPGKINDAIHSGFLAALKI